MDENRIAGELRALGASLETPRTDSDAVATAVMARLEAEGAPRPAATTAPLRAAWSAAAGWRAALAVLAAALVATLAVTPVRAAVAEFLGIGGVDVRPGPAVASAPPPAAVADRMNLDDAVALVRFDPLVPALLGEPDAVDVAPDGRWLAMSWSDGGRTVRMDQFEGPLLAKLVRVPADPVTLGGGVTALWVAEPHELRLEEGMPFDPAGDARPAGPTLVLAVGEVTVRLEGADRHRAVEIARSLLEPGT